MCVCLLCDSRNGELQHWEDEDYVGATLEEQAKHTDWEEEVKKEVVIEKEVIKEYIKLPKETKGWIETAAKHAKRRGDKVPKNLNRFFD